MDIPSCSILFRNPLRLAAGLTLAVAGGTPLAAQSGDTIGRLTRYVVKPAGAENFRHALSQYVFEALADEGNVQAEAYYERDDRNVMWLIERWQDRSQLERFGHSPQAQALEALQGRALQTTAEVHYVKDLEPLSKAQWRRAARATDQPLTIMLFVDAKAGTQDEFKATYRVALPAFRGEPGVVTYQLSQLEGDETKYVTYEKFRSDDAFAYHLAFPPIKPVIDYLNTSIKQQPFQSGLHTLIEFAPLTRAAGGK